MLPMRARNRRRAAVPGLVAALLLAAAFVPSAPARTDAGPRKPVSGRVLASGLPRGGAEELARWHHGPVRYLLTGAEARLFASLQTDRERRAFIQTFWLRRDPDSSSLENEFRFDFWRRVAEANHLFTRTTEPGWKTDRGRHYVLLGPPDEIESTVMPNQRSGVRVVTQTLDDGQEARILGGDAPSETFRGLERWIYRSRPGRRLPPNFIIAFRLNAAGDYELSTDSRDWALFQDMLSEATAPLPGLELGGLPSDPGRQTDLLELYSDVAVALDLGSISTVPSPDQLLGELVTSEEFFGLIPFLLQADYYKTTGPETLAVFTIGIDRRAVGAMPRAARQEFLAVGKLESVEDPGRQLLLSGEDALVASPDNLDQDLLLFQVVKALPPGSYNATFGILERSRERIGSYRERIRVPAFPALELSLSSLALARDLTPLEEGPAEAGTPAVVPFRLGNYQVVPKTGRSFRNGEEFALYYQVYGARPDPSTGQPRLDVTYRFFVLHDDRFVPIGEPVRYAGRSRSVQGWSFPILNWPAATFRLEVTVEDTVSGQVAVGQTIFGIERVEERL